MTRDNAYKLITESETAKSLVDQGIQSPNRRQARELAKVEPERRKVFRAVAVTVCDGFARGKCDGRNPSQFDRRFRDRCKRP